MAVKINNELWNNIAMSGIRVVMEKVRAMKAEGENVIGLTAGEPDFHTPEDIKKYTIEALNRNLTHYTSNRGAMVLREKISNLYKEKTNIVYDPNTEILITTGGAEAINNAFATSILPNKEVIIFSPAFMNYENMVVALGAKPVFICLKAENEYQIDIEEVKEKITENTTHIVINNPCNPTGAVYQKDTLKKLCKLAIEKDITIISDEMYSDIVYGDAEFHSIASFEGMKDQSIIINGFSKTYAMTGWRLGYVLSSKEVIEAMVKPHQYSTTSGVTFIQEGVALGMDTQDTKRELRCMKKSFENRRNLICSLLDEVPKISYVKPQGAFYIMVNVSQTGLTGKAFSDRLLEKKKCAVIPAVALGKECVDYIRISYATDEDTIIEAVRRIKEFIDSLD